MTLRDLIDAVFLKHAEKVAAQQEAIQNAGDRLDLEAGVDRYLFIPGYGHLLGIPTRPGESSTATTGVPTNSIGGFAKGALFINFKGSAASLLYVNTGTATSATWTNIV